jgi:hypothetical protein
LQDGNQYKESFAEMKLALAGKADKSNAMYALDKIVAPLFVVAEIASSRYTFVLVKTLPLAQLESESLWVT